MGGIASEGLLGRVGRFASKFEIGNKIVFGKSDPLNLFTKPLEGVKASTGASINKPNEVKKPANKKGVRQVRSSTTNTPLSSDPDNPLGGRS